MPTTDFTASSDDQHIDKDDLVTKVLRHTHGLLAATVYSPDSLCREHYPKSLTASRLEFHTKSENHSPNVLQKHVVFLEHDVAAFHCGKLQALAQEGIVESAATAVVRQELGI